MTCRRPSPFTSRPLDCELGRRFGSLGVEMLGTSSAIYLLVKPDGTRPSTSTDEVRRYRRHWTPVHLDFVVSELEAAVSKAIEAGVTIEGEMQTHDWGRIAHMAVNKRRSGTLDRIHINPLIQP